MLGDLQPAQPHSHNGAVNQRRHCRLRVTGLMFCAARTPGHLDRVESSRLTLGALVLEWPLRGRGVLGPVVNSLPNLPVLSGQASGNLECNGEMGELRPEPGRKPKM